MFNKLWTDEQYNACKEIALKCRTVFQVQTEFAELCKKKGWPTRTKNGIHDVFRQRGVHLGDFMTAYGPNEINPVDELKKEVSRLRAELSDNQKRLSIYSSMSNPTPPKWLCSSSKASTTGRPLMLLSDLHYDEVIDPKQIEGSNSYDIKIANQSIRNTIDKAVMLAFRFMNAPRYDGIIVACAGDFLSGTIHEELRETNEEDILQALAMLRDQLIWAFMVLHEKFGNVYVPWVVGNHGRLSIKPQAKGKVKNNYEWLLGDMLRKHFEREKDIRFDVSDSSDITFPVYNKRFLLTHGDQFKGGSGISGFLSPMLIGHARKQRRQQALQKPFDTMLMGHFHQYVHTENVVMNGSMCGYNEYAYVNNFQYEEPKQAYFICHPQHGVTYRMPILCRGGK